MDNVDDEFDNIIEVNFGPQDEEASDAELQVMAEELWPDARTRPTVQELTTFAAAVECVPEALPTLTDIFHMVNDLVEDASGSLHVEAHLWGALSVMMASAGRAVIAQAIDAADEMNDEEDQ